MTIIRLDLVGTQLDADAKAQLASRLISSFCEVEVGRDIEAAHQGFVVQVSEMSADSVFMGDAPMADASPAGRAAILAVQVMAGPWTTEMKAALFDRLEGIVRDACDIPKRGSGADVWMTIVEVPDGGWGVGGRAVSIAKLAPAFTEDRQSRIQQHLAREGS